MKASTYYAVVPEWLILHPAVSDGAVRLYALLRRYADMPGAPKIQTLADQLNKSRSSIHRHLNELVKVGALRPYPGTQGLAQYVIESVAYETPSLFADSAIPEITGDPPAVGDLFAAVVATWLGDEERTLTRSERGRINKAVSELAAIGATPDDVHHRAETYRRRLPSATYSPQALVRNWGYLDPQVTPIHEHTWELVEAGDASFYHCTECDAKSARFDIGAP